MIIVGVVVGSILFLSGVPEPENEADKVVPDGEFALPTFTPRLFFLILLPPVILESAYSLYDRSFADNLSTILVYAVAGTLLNTFIVGPLLYLISIGGLMGMINITLTDTIVFAALISAVDPVAVLAIFQEVGVNKDLYYLLFGESLLNDAVTVVLYTTTVTFTEMSKIDGIQYGLAFIAFFTVSIGGLVIGIFFGLLSALLTKTTKDVRVVEPLAVLGIAYLSYLAAELFHFSGIISIIGCGLVQAHYALKNISDNSRTTVTYFTKMISSTSDAIIFLFLGMVLVSKRHVWHTGFVLWTLLLCLLCRFAVVFSLTALVNIFRVKKINTQEQFIMAYGGLRGAVAFSLVTMLDEDVVISQPIFLTTTLVVILFTVFIQGGTIKLFVKLLNIKKSDDKEKTMNEEINDNIIRTMMAGIEEITGVRGDYYVRRKAEYIDEHYLKKIFLNPTKSNSLTRLYEKLALTQHYAHLYGPVALVEDQKAVILHEDDNKDRKKQLLRSMSARTPTRPGLRLSDLIQGVQLRRRTLSDTTRPDQTQLETNELRTSTEQLRKAFRSNPYSKFNERYNRNLINEDSDITNMLRKRHLTTQRITYVAALSNRHSASPVEDIPLEDEFKTPRRKIHSELEGVDPEALEGIDVIIDRQRRRVARHSSNVEVFARDSFSHRLDNSSPNAFRSQVYSSLRNNNYLGRSPGNLNRTRTPRWDLSSETAETQRLMRPLLRQHSSLARYSTQDADVPSTPPSPSMALPRAPPPSSRQSQNSEAPDTPTEDTNESKL
ncbi:UNVERIFIED_CONTAM: hypothetical protein PYX00_001793 [Menopon gallinae]